MSRAEQLFIQGKDQLARGFYAQACVSLAESYQLDPATGCLLALAMCHEREGKLASAQKEYLEATGRARKEGDAKREAAAFARANALITKISNVEIVLSPDIRNYAIKLRVNGALIAAEQIGKRIPVDGGPVIVEASADGRESWTRTLQVPSGGGSVFLMVPALKELPKSTSQAAGAKLPPPVSRPKQPPPVDDLPPKSVRPTGIALMAAGGLGIAVGGVFGLRAVVRNRASDDGCNLETCTPEGREDRESARTSGNAASGFMSAGLVLGTSGVVMFVIDRRARHRAGSSRHALQMSPWFSPAGGGASARGTF